MLEAEWQGPARPKQEFVDRYGKLNDSFLWSGRLGGRNGHHVEGDGRIFQWDVGLARAV